MVIVRARTHEDQVEEEFGVADSALGVFAVKFAIELDPLPYDGSLNEMTPGQRVASIVFLIVEELDVLQPD